MRRISDIRIGERAELTHMITREDMERFVELTGDDNKLHVDGEFAGKTTLRKPVVHGMLGASFISTIIGTKLPGDGALWFSQQFDFLLPVRIGDEITVIAEVTKKSERDRVIELKTEIFNQYHQKVTTGTAKVKLIELQELPEERQVSGKERVALVIGATGGIGTATALQLARDGFDIVLHYHSNIRSAKQLKKTIEGMGRRAIVVKADITSDQQVKAMVDEILRHFSGITVLVNCSTIRIATIRFSDMPWEQIRDHLDINVKGFFTLVKNVFPVMEKEQYGVIIAIITQAVETPSSGWLHYITAKAALQGFSKALAIELAPKGIRVNMVSPGMTETELIADIPEKAKLLTAAKAPLRRLARPEDVANAISFLASGNSDYLTGETIRVNGGQVML
jgi:3-oxoacyl-[acyl-carrier protein] reductase